MHTIAVIGAGQLGSRHLQGLARINIAVAIRVVDPNPGQLEVARSRFQEIPEHVNIPDIQYLGSLQDLETDIDLCIIATTSDIRSSVTKDIISGRNVRNILFEKVLFQSIQEYDDIQTILTNNNIGAWVNCSRRLYPIYKKIRTFFNPGEKITYRVSGSLWGLACNAIHFIDQVLFLSRGYPCEIDISHLEKAILESKRPGFIELAGTLRMIFDNGSEMILDSKQAETGQDLIIISGSHYHIVVVETLGKAIVTHVNDSMDWQEMNFRNPFQSELTHLVATDILLNGHSELATFRESTDMHKLMLKGFINHIEAVTGRSVTNCPIT